MLKSQKDGKSGNLLYLDAHSPPKSSRTGLMSHAGLGFSSRSPDDRETVSLLLVRKNTVVNDVGVSDDSYTESV